MGYSAAGDPLILEVKGNSLDDGPGIRTVVFFKGCPLSCVWCHNPESKRTGAELAFDPRECVSCFEAVFRDIAGINGTGRYERVDVRYKRDEHDYDTVSISEPHSAPLAVSAHVGAVEILTGVEQGYAYEEKSPDFCHITTFPSPHPEELKERLWFRPHEHTDGDIELERCSTCGGPHLL